MSNTAEYQRIATFCHSYYALDKLRIKYPDTIFLFAISDDLTAFAPDCDALLSVCNDAHTESALLEETPFAYAVAPVAQTEAIIAALTARGNRVGLIG